MEVSLESGDHREATVTPVTTDLVRTKAGKHHVILLQPSSSGQILNIYSNKTCGCIIIKWWREEVCSVFLVPFISCSYLRGVSTLAGVNEPQK